MKKTFVKGDLAAIEKAVATNSQIIVGRGASAAWVQNLELLPKEAFDLKVDKEKNEVVLKIKLLPGEYIAIMDTQGIAAKREV